MNYEQLTEDDSPAYSNFWKAVGDANKAIAKLKPLTPAQLFTKAHEAGMKAGNDVIPNPMVVVGGGRSYFVGEGVCGFASIVIKPARGKFVQWLKANKNTYKHYYGGIAIFVGEFGQSLTRKEAYASAFVKVLASAGINAHVDSRMD